MSAFGTADISLVIRHAPMSAFDLKRHSILLGREEARLADFSKGLAQNLD